MKRKAVPAQVAPAAPHASRVASAERQALEAYLGDLAARVGAPALVLAGADGAVLGSARRAEDTHDLEAVAALGRACATGADVADADLARVCGGDDLYAHALRTGDRTYFLASLGARVPRVRDVESTLASIFGAAPGDRRG